MRRKPTTQLARTGQQAQAQRQDVIESQLREFLSDSELQEVKNANELIKFIALLATFAERFERNEITYGDGHITVKEDHITGTIRITADLTMRRTRNVK